MDTEVNGVGGQGKLDLVRFEECGSELLVVGETFSRFLSSNSLQGELCKYFRILYCPRKDPYSTYRQNQHF